MSDPINANPTVLDVSQLPTRQENDNDAGFGSAFASGNHGSKSNTSRKALTPLDTFSRNILTHDLWDQYHNRDLYLYSIVDEDQDSDAEFSDPEEGNVLSESEDENDQKTKSPKSFAVPGSLPQSISSSPSVSLAADKVLANQTKSKLVISEHQDPIDSQEIYDLISTISDPEHPLTLGQLAVVNLPHIYVTDSGKPDEIAEVFVEITPTITHCSLATLIGLGIRVRLERALPARFRILIKVRPGTHQSEKQVNKQLNDKERVAAACENQQLLGVISNMLDSCT